MHHVINSLPATRSGRRGAKQAAGDPPTSHPTHPRCTATTSGSPTRTGLGTDQREARAAPDYHHHRRLAAAQVRPKRRRRRRRQRRRRRRRRRQSHRSPRRPRRPEATPTGIRRVNGRGRRLAPTLTATTTLSAAPAGRRRRRSRWRRWAGFRS